MLGVILAGAVLGAATLIIVKGRRPERKPVRVEARDERKGKQR